MGRNLRIICGSAETIPVPSSGAVADKNCIQPQRGICRPAMTAERRLGGFNLPPGQAALSLGRCAGAQPALGAGHGWCQRPHHCCSHACALVPGPWTCWLWLCSGSTRHRIGTKSAGLRAGCEPWTLIPAIEDAVSALLLPVFAQPCVWSCAVPRCRAATHTTSGSDFRVEKGLHALNRARSLSSCLSMSLSLCRCPCQVLDTVENWQQHPGVGAQCLWVTWAQDPHGIPHPCFPLSSQSGGFGWFPSPTLR